MPSTDPDRPRVARFAVAEHVRTARDEDGLVLLDLRTGQYITLNEVAGAIWAANAGGANEDAIVRSLAGRFDVPVEQVQQDVAATLRSFADSGWIVPQEAGGPPIETRPRPADPAPGNAEGSTPTEAPPPSAGSFVWRARAFLTLIGVDLLLLLFRFRRLYSLLERRRQTAQRADPATLATICRAVDRAAASYFKRAWCLQRSAACVLLLRGQGFPARLVLGVRTFPFEAHAWAEVDGAVVNDQLDYVARFQVLDRV